MSELTEDKVAVIRLLVDRRNLLKKETDALGLVIRKFQTGEWDLPFTILEPVSTRKGHTPYRTYSDLILRALSGRRLDTKQLATELRADIPGLASYHLNSALRKMLTEGLVQVDTTSKPFVYSRRAYISKAV